MPIFIIVGFVGENLRNGTSPPSPPQPPIRDQLQRGPSWTGLRLEEQVSTCVCYDKLTEIFKETTDKQAPQKKRKIPGNQAPFMTKELSTQIMGRSKSKNFYFKWPSREIFLAYKIEKNKCNNMTKYSKKVYFRKSNSKKRW